MRRFLRVAGIVAAVVFASAGTASAHPLGNFTVNHLTRITASAGAVTVKYVLDEAEIPTFALDRSLDRRGTPAHDVLQRWAERHAAAIVPDLQLAIDGRAAGLAVQGVTVEERPGAGGLPTLYLTASYRAAVAPGAHRLTYRDTTEEGRLGWRDVVLGDAVEPTHELRAYPGALVGSPRAQTSIAATLNAATLAAASDPAGAAPENGGVPLARSNALSDVLARGAGDPLVVIGALLLAIALGALHALEPGHGKTLLAVSLVGARATPRQALVLASALTAAHTAGVLALGFVVLFATQWIVPERIYPWITLASGTVVAVLGARALAREIRRRLPFAHAHPHAHSHAHPHAHEHVHAAGDLRHHHHGEATHSHADLDELAHAHAHALPGTAPLTFRSAVVAAASGNIAPCPAALVVLLAAISLHQVGYGIALIVAFSLGLAAVLTVLGVAVVRSAAWLVARPRFDAAARFAPLVTAFVIAAVGAVMVGQGLGPQLGTPPVAIAALVLAAAFGYAFAWHRHRVPAQAAA